MKPLDIVLILFLLTQLISLGVGVLLIEGAKTNPALYALNIAPDESRSISNSFYLLVSILIGAALILILLLMPFKKYLILIVEFISAIFASFVVFFVFLSAFNIGYADFIALILSLLLFILRMIFISFRNLLAMIAAAGIGAVIAFSIDPIPLFIFVILLAIYDILAVRWTKHMVKFAQYFMKEKTSFSIGFEGTRQIKIREQGKIISKEQPWHIELGTGDAAVASMITVVSYKLGGLIFPTISMLASTLGLYLVFINAARSKEIMPALPYIVGVSLIAILIVSGLLGILNTSFY
ncbi:MAG: presenilin family intramembrane aspartyl protease [Candidatus Micrarchaeia archaeon]